MQDDTNSTLLIEQVPHLPLVEKARSFDNQGVVIQRGGYFFLKINDNFIHELYPYLSQFGNLEKPDYFTEPQMIGAHITIAYPEENTFLGLDELGQLHTFQIKALCKAAFNNKEYFVLSVNAPSLKELREKYDLPAKPLFMSNRIDFHITIGVK